MVFVRVERESMEGFYADIPNALLSTCLLPKDDLVSSLGIRGLRCRLRGGELNRSQAVSRRS